MRLEVNYVSALSAIAALNGINSIAGKNSPDWLRIGAATATMLGLVAAAREIVALRESEKVVAVEAALLAPVIRAPSVPALQWGYF